MRTYTIGSAKGSRAVSGTIDEAIAAAVEMERDLQPAYGVTVELDGETVAEVRDGVVEREDEPTTAEQAASIMGDDGGRSTAPDGRSLQQVCRSLGAEVWRRECGDRRYEFKDGSAIVTSCGAWDLRHADCECGWCWAGDGSLDAHCDEPHGSEWMLTTDTLDAEDAEHDAERAE